MSKAATDAVDHGFQLLVEYETFRTAFEARPVFCKSDDRDLERGRLYRVFAVKRAVTQPVLVRVIGPHARLIWVIPSEGWMVEVAK